MNAELANWTLRHDRIIETVAQLKNRISDRFPDSGLSRLCEHQLEVAQQAAERADAINKPIRWIRVISLLITVMVVAVLVAVVVVAVEEISSEDLSLFGSIEKLDAGVNELIFLAIAIVFLFSLETRLKRSRALSAVHELRSIAHVIDMHQLTKDPERVLRHYADAEHSPRQNMTPLELNRYLDYCSEMLSLTGKIAAVYIQHFDDAEAVAAVSEVEQLTTGLSRKIWQKIMILQQLRDDTESLESKPPTKPVSGSAEEHENSNNQDDESS